MRRARLRAARPFTPVPCYGRYMQGEKDYCVFYGLAFALVSMGHGDLAGLVAAAAKYSVGEAEGYGDEPVRFLRSLVKGQVKLPSKCEREADEGMKCLWLLGRELRKAWQLEKVAPDDVLNDESLHPTVCVLFNSHGSGHHCVTIVGKGANRRVYDSSEKWVADHLQEPEVARRVLQGRRARSGLLRSRRCLRPTGAQISQEGTGRVAAGARRPPHGESSGGCAAASRGGCEERECEERERERSTRGAR